MQKPVKEKLPVQKTPQDNASNYEPEHRHRLRQITLFQSRSATAKELPEERITAPPSPNRETLLDAVLQEDAALQLQIPELQDDEADSHHIGHQQDAGQNSAEQDKTNNHNHNGQSERRIQTGNVMSAVAAENPDDHREKHHQQETHIHNSLRCQVRLQ